MLARLLACWELMLACLLALCRYNQKHHENGIFCLSDWAFLIRLASGGGGGRPRKED